MSQDLFRLLYNRLCGYSSLLTALPLAILTSGVAHLLSITSPLGCGACSGSKLWNRYSCDAPEISGPAQPCKAKTDVLGRSDSHAFPALPHCLTWPHPLQLVPNLSSSTTRPQTLQSSLSQTSREIPTSLHDLLHSVDNRLPRLKSAGYASQPKMKILLLLPILLPPGARLVPAVYKLMKPVC